MTDDKAALTEAMQACIGKPVGPFRGWDPVNETMIRHWCDAMGDDNPVYTDPEAAAQSVHGGIIAPPAMLQAWTMRGYRGRHAPGSDEREPFAMFEILEERGYPAVVAVNCEQTYFEPLRPGDSLRHTSQIESISEEKTTALGVGFFITELCEFWNQRDEKVAEMRFRVFKYRAHQAQETDAEQPAAAAPAAARRMRPVRNHDTAFFWEGVDRGELLIQRCRACGALRHPPAPMCRHCQSLDWETVRASGRGRVHSFVVMHHPQIPPFDYPNPVVLIELEEGTRLVSQMTGIRPRDIRIDMPVEVVFESVEEGLTLPLFRPLREEN